jgi:hypothetical protein
VDAPVALHHLTVALRAAGYASNVQLTPDEQETARPPATPRRPLTEILS